MGIVSEFKEFAVKGNVIDLAVGVIIGAAFGKIVTSFVDDLIMPTVGKVTGGVNFADMLVSLDGKTYESAKLAKEAGAPAIYYGSFLTILIQFLIVAFVIFMMVKMINRLKRAEPEPEPVPEAPAADVVLLTEIRDLLKSKA